MKTRDGVRLDADVYRPDGPRPYPVLLMRQPYGRAIASTVTYAHPSWYARHGYIVVVQDVRVRGSSEGEFDLLAAERADGFDTVEWAARLPGKRGHGRHVRLLLPGHNPAHGRGREAAGPAGDLPRDGGLGFARGHGLRERRVPAPERDGVGHPAGGRDRAPARRRGRLPGAPRRLPQRAGVGGHARTPGRARPVRPGHPLPPLPPPPAPPPLLAPPLPAPHPPP